MTTGKDNQLQRSRQQANHVHLGLMSIGFCARIAGYPIVRMYDNPEKSFWAQVWTEEMYDCQGSPAYVVAASAAWDFGGDIKFPNSEWQQAPSVERYPVQSEEDVYRLELPDARTAGSIPFAMEFSKLCEHHHRPITLSITSPFTSTGNVCSLDRLCRWILKKPEVAHKLIGLVTNHLLQVAQYWVDTFGIGHVNLAVGTPSESNQVISQKQFEEFAFPYIKELHEKALGMGIRRILCHICGEQNLNLPYYAQIPMGNPGIVSFGHEVDLNTAIRYFGDSCVIAGNVEPQVIQNGTPQEVYELSKQCIEKGKQSPKGFVLMPGCELPPMAPPYNVYMLKKAVNDFGWYD